MRIMLDLETLGKAAGCAVWSIGAVAFDEDNVQVGSGFHCYLDLNPQRRFGLTIDPSTVIWWMEQKQEAQQAMVAGSKRAIHPAIALRDFGIWYRENGGEELWGNGSDFDLPILGAICDAFSITKPWAYNAGRCCRTIFKLIHRRMGDFGTPNVLAHDALQDAIYQAKEVSAALRWLRDGTMIATMGDKK